MPRICFDNGKRGLTDRTRATIDMANEIIAEHMEDGFTLTVRQLYYQFIARDAFPNTMKSYKRLVRIVDRGRKAGLIDWDAIVDRGRGARALAHYSGAEDAVAECVDGFGMNLWADQDADVEVWVEKQALEPVVARAANAMDCTFMACKGYLSQSEMYEAHKRFKRRELEGRKQVLIHLGDHDPSGLNMTTDTAKRLNELFGVHVHVERIALNMDQVRQYNPPPNFAKETDTRFKRYAERFGDKCWELDALKPRVLVELITSAIQEHCDMDKFEEARRRQEAERDRLRAIASGNHGSGSNESPICKAYRELYGDNG